MSLANEDSSYDVRIEGDRELRASVGMLGLTSLPNRCGWASLIATDTQRRTTSLLPTGRRSWSWSTTPPIRS